MRTLTVNEVQVVSGGFVRELIVGLLGAYIYEKAGGAEGIEEGVSNIVDNAPPISTAHVRGSK
jgi:hypothetical protein